MFPMTPALKDHLVKTFALKADATDDEVMKLAATKFAAGELTVEKIKELTAPVTDKAAEFKKMVADAVAESLKGLLPVPAKTAEVPDPTAALAAKEAELMASFKAKMDEYEASFATKLKERIASGEPSAFSGNKAFGILAMGANVDKDDSPVSVHVKSVRSKFNETRYDAKRNSKTSDPEHKLIRKHGSHGDVMQTPSQFSKAMGAVWFKYLVAPEHLTENDALLLKHILHKEKFIIHGHNPDVGVITPQECDAPRLLNAKEIHDMITKATVVIADATSGGTYATPEFFDTDFILLPVLGNELGPLCNIIDVPRGAAAQGFTMANPTWTSGSTEGSAVTPLTTTSFIANHDATFFRAAGAMEFGLNFLEDAVPGVIDQVMGRVMAKAGEWIDEQVAMGDGTTEPEGIFTTSGVTNPTIATATTGPYVLGDFTEVLFAVQKAFRTAYPANRASFIMTDPAYYLVRSIATGVTGDTRLIFGMDIESYMLFGHPVAIVATGLTNDQFAFLQCGGYRLYRRQGPRFRRTTEGRTALLANILILGYDMRWGGQLDRTGYAAVETSGIP